jgi:hypothetical protein
MVGVKELCALLLAGGVGAGSVVAVDHAKAPVARAKPKSKPKVAHGARPAMASARPALGDCPSLAAPLGAGLVELSPVAEPASPPVTALLDQGGGPGGRTSDDGGLQLPPVIGGGGAAPPAFPGGPNPPGTAPGVPQPAAWAMMLTGFGLVGMALRRPAQRGRPGDSETGRS